MRFEILLCSLVLFVQLTRASSLAANCSPAKVSFNKVYRELRVRGIEQSPHTFTIQLPVDLDNPWEALEEMFKLSYRALLRCSTRTYGTYVEDVRQTAIDAQTFANEGKAMVDDRIERWASRSNSRLATLSEFMWSESSWYMVRQPMELHINREIVSRLEGVEEYGEFLSKASRNTRSFIFDQDNLNDARFGIP